MKKLLFLLTLISSFAIAADCQKISNEDAKRIRDLQNKIVYLEAQLEGKDALIKASNVKADGFERLYKAEMHRADVIQANRIKFLLGKIDNLEKANASLTLSNKELFSANADYKAQSKSDAAFIKTLEKRVKNLKTQRYYIAALSFAGGFYVRGTVKF